MKNPPQKKEECSPSHGSHGTSTRRTEAATSKVSMAVAQNSRIDTINELDPTAEQLLTGVERTPISTVTPA